MSTYVLIAETNVFEARSLQGVVRTEGLDDLRRRLARR